MRSNVNCCVVGCSNTYTNTQGQNITFHSFPGQNWEIERRERWITAVNRKNQDGTPWKPTKNARICSAHFVDGKASNIMSHPGYIPSIFPAVYGKRKSVDSTRFKRAKKRSGNKVNESSKSNENLGNVDVEVAAADYCETSLHISASTQCNLDYEKSVFHFSCEKVDNDMQTQCNIIDIATANVNKADKNCGPSSFLDICKGFHGFENIKKEQTLKDLTSVSMETFYLFLSFLSTVTFYSVTNKNALLLFFMKMKINITFGALAALFCVHRTTASRIFFTVLETVAVKTKNYIFWPPKHIVQQSMPETFKECFPNVRVIIDCTEIKTEVPAKVEDRIYMYSSYKSCHTFKFLVAITPNGYIAFNSCCYGGKTSDVFITNNCGFLHYLEDGDIVLADKGFPGINARLEKEVVVVMPPILHNGRFTAEEVLRTQSIASVRVHVERCIRRIKIFNILKFIPIELFPYIDDIVHVACVLANYMPPIFKEQKSG